MTSKPLSFALAALLIAGCSTASPPAGRETAATTCTREIPTGSSIAVTRCRSTEDVERDAEAARSAGEAIQRSRSGARAPSTQ